MSVCVFVVKIEFHRKRKQRQVEKGRVRKIKEEAGTGRQTQAEVGIGRQRQAKAAKVVGNVPSLYIPGRSK